MARPAALFVPLLVAATVAASVIAWNEHREIEALGPVGRKAALLASENDSLREAVAAAERKATDAQNGVRRAQIERDVAEIRELNFTKPVVYESLDRAGIRQVVAGKLSEAYSDEEIRNMSTGYAAFGLLPPNFPLKQTYTDLLGEQIAAFYDQHQHKLFMFQDASLEGAQNRVILAHELTHALQDQNFGLLKLPIEVKDNDDRAAAASALIEGDATLVMSEYMAKDFTWKSISDTVGYSATQSMEQIRKAPHYLREMLVFPYLKGQQFCAAVFARGGYQALSAVYANPPESTAQILHPEKYFHETREDPVAVGFADTSFNGMKALADNVLGEMGVHLMLEQYLGTDATDSVAAGWRGDRYLVFDGGNELVWKTVWRSPGAAGEAVTAFRAVCARRFKGDRPGTGHIVTAVNIGANEVVFILAADEKTSKLLNEKFAGASHG